MRANNGKNPTEEKGRTAKPREIKIEKDYQNSSRFKVPIPIRLNFKSDDKLYTESKYTLHTSSKTNKLATIDDFRSKAFSSSQLVASQNYAAVGSNWMTDPSAPPKLSNEKVKVELVKDICIHSPKDSGEAKFTKRYLMYLLVNFNIF